MSFSVIQIVHLFIWGKLGIVRIAMRLLLLTLATSMFKRICSQGIYKKFFRRKLEMAAGEWFSPIRLRAPLVRYTTPAVIKAHGDMTLPVEWHRPFLGGCLAWWRRQLMKMLRFLLSFKKSFLNGQWGFRYFVSQAIVSMFCGFLAKTPSLFSPLQWMRIQATLKRLYPHSNVSSLWCVKNRHRVSQALFFTEPIFFLLKILDWFIIH